MERGNLLTNLIFVILLITCVIISGCEEIPDAGGDNELDPPAGETIVNDFTQISGSGYITLELNGLGVDEIFGRMIMYGASGIPSGGWERVGSSATADASTKTLIIENDSAGFLFTGGDIIGNIGCILDASGDGDVGDGDYYGGLHDHVISGNVTITLTYPEDFTLISGSGYITLYVTGLDELNGKTMMYGAAGIPTGQYERIGGEIVLEGQSAVRIPLENEGSDYLFSGGDTVGMLGCIIDVNDNEEADDGDFIGGAYDHLIVGNETITLAYPDDFTLISGSGYITLEVTGLAEFSVSTIMYGASGIQSGQAERIGDSTTINSSTMTMIMSNEGNHFKFTGGNTISGLGCVIDANDNEVADDGDWVGGIYNHLMAGSEVLTLNYNP